MMGGLTPSVFCCYLTLRDLNLPSFLSTLNTHNNSTHTWPQGSTPGAPPPPHHRSHPAGPTTPPPSLSEHRDQAGHSTGGRVGRGPLPLNCRGASCHRRADLWVRIARAFHEHRHSCGCPITSLSLASDYCRAPRIRLKNRSSSSRLIQRTTTTRSWSGSTQIMLAPLPAWK